jgi:hypothetical protein
MINKMKCRACLRDKAACDYEGIFVCATCFRAIIALNKFLPEDGEKLDQRHTTAVEDRAGFIYAVMDHSCDPENLKRITTSYRRRWLQCRNWWASNRLGLA